MSPLSYRRYSGVVILLGLLVPPDLLVVLERQGGEVPHDSGDLSGAGRSDRFFLAFDGPQEIMNVVRRGIGLVEVLEVIQVNFGPVLDGLAIELLRNEVEILAADDAQG